MNTTTIDQAAETVVTQVLALSKDEPFLILINPDRDVYKIRMAL